MLFTPGCPAAGMFHFDTKSSPQIKIGEATPTPASHHSGYREYQRRKVQAGKKLMSGPPHPPKRWRSEEVGPAGCYAGPSCTQKQVNSPNPAGLDFLSQICDYARWCGIMRSNLAPMFNAQIIFEEKRMQITIQIWYKTFSETESNWLNAVLGLLFSNFPEKANLSIYY